jgi:hypothetical protein
MGRASKLTLARVSTFLRQRTSYQTEGRNRASFTIHRQRERLEGSIPNIFCQASLALRPASRITALVFVLISSKISSVLTRLA